MGLIGGILKGACFRHGDREMGVVELVNFDIAEIVVGIGRC